MFSVGTRGERWDRSDGSDSGRKYGRTSCLERDRSALVMRRNPTEGAEFVVGMGREAPYFMRCGFVADNGHEDDTDYAA
jgi:hypothetical protein